MHSEQLGIVNLDEFDRLKPDVRDGLFTIFDKGEWVDKQLHDDLGRAQTSTLDCHKIIWLLTTNAFDAPIDAFYQKEDVRLAFDQGDWKTVDRKLKRAFRRTFELKFGNAMARRIGSLLPFVPFTERERVALIESEIDAKRVALAKPTPEPDPTTGKKTRLVCNFNFTVDKAVITTIAAAYHKKAGATSIKDFIVSEIVEPIYSLYLEECTLEHTSANFRLVGKKGEEDIELDWAGGSRIGFSKTSFPRSAQISPS